MDGATVAVLLTEVTAAFVPLPGEPMVRLGSGAPAGHTCPHLLICGAPDVAGSMGDRNYADEGASDVSAVAGVEFVRRF